MARVAPAAGRAGLGLALALQLAGCQTVPVTGRQQLILLPQSQEAELGGQAFQQIRQQERLSADQQLVRRVQEVGRRIAAVSERPDWDWAFILFENEIPNAFALPSGKIGVYTGLFEVAANDAQLAAVLSHEVAHAIARHGAERLSQQLALQTVLAMLGVTTGQQAYVELAAQAATLGVVLPYSRIQESEADEIGVRYMAMAGYDPREAIRLWRNFQALDVRRPPSFYRPIPCPRPASGVSRR